MTEVYVQCIMVTALVPARDPACGGAHSAQSPAEDMVLARLGRQKSATQSDLSSLIMNYHILYLC